MKMKGVLLVNLGSPDSTNTKDVRNYLEEFLMDQRVIDLPKWFRSFLVKGIILNTRPKKSAKAYKKIWWDKGSPLIVLSEKLQKNNTTTSDFIKQNQKLDHTIQELTAKIKKMEHEKMTNEISHQKQILQKDNQIERYKTSLEDLRERYNEMKDDNKELRKNK